MKETLLRQRLREGDPAPLDTQYSEAKIVQMLNEMMSGDQNVTKFRSPRRRRVLVTAAMVIAIMLAPVAKFGLQSPISPVAADILIRAADSVDPSLVPQPGQYWRITSEQWQDDGRETTHVMYRPAFEFGPKYVGLFGDGEGEGGWWLTIDPKGFVGYWADPTTDFVKSLPREVNALRKVLYADSEGHGSTSDGSAFNYAMDFLKSGMADAELQAVLLRVIATVPGVEVSLDAKAPDGRMGVGLKHAELLGAYDFLGNIIGEGGLRGKEIILDVNTGEVIGERNFWFGRITFQSSRTRELVDEVPADVIEMAMAYAKK